MYRTQQALKHSQGFTLAELLIALAILGVIATFTIPKIISAQTNTAYNAHAHEVAAMISGAYHQYTQENGYSPSVGLGALTPYMNYVSIDYTSVIDNVQTLTTENCGGGMCLRLHNGGTLYKSGNATWSFGGTATTNAMTFHFDPDGKVTDGTTNGPGKAVGFYLYYNGRITSAAYKDPATCGGGGSCAGAIPAYEPPWFNW